MNNRYETLMLLSTEMTNDELAAIEQQFEHLISQAKGEMFSFDKWGKYHLAYPVNKNDYGVYVLTRYNLPQGALADITKELNHFFKIKCSDVVMRFVNKRLDEDAPKDYIKPEPVDSGGRKSFDSFIKDNKMQGILSTDVSTSASDKTKVDNRSKVESKVQKESSELDEIESTQSNREK